MSIIRKRNLIPLILALILVALGTTVVAAQDAAPPPPQPQDARHDPSAPFQNLDGLWIMPASAQADRAPEAAPATTGGPDDFGYTWDDSVPLNWISAAGGANAGVSPNDPGSNAIAIGFPFKYYENTYTQLYIVLHGYLTFTDQSDWMPQSRIPNPGPPNNVIAPLWVPIDYASYVRYLRGGAAPNRWFAVEWNQAVSNCCASGLAEEYTFEAILHENGNIDFQYGVMRADGNWVCQASGIEDPDGLDGLAITGFCNQIPEHHALRVYRPAPDARVSIMPASQSDFAHAGVDTAFEITIRNMGDLGPDIYDLLPDAPWPLILLHADGVTPVSDSDGDGTPDTGSIPQGGSRTVIVRVTTPTDASVGNHITASLTVRSSLNTGIQKTTEMRMAVPASFVQAYEVWGGPMSLLLARREAHLETTATAGSFYGNNIAIAEQLDGHLVYIWTRGRCHSNCTVAVDEIERTIIDPYGEVVVPATRLFDLSGATFDTRDYPTVAVAPNGRIGLLWERYLWDRVTYRYNYNMYFAVLSPAGDLIHGPTNVTQNDVWGNSGDRNVPVMYSPRITATADNRFVLAWFRGHNESQGYVNDIWYSVRQSNGVMIKAATNLTHDGTDYSDAYASPTLATVAGNRALLAFSRSGDYRDIYFVVLDGNGNVVRSMDNLSGDSYNTSEYRPDAVELSNGRILVAWTGEQFTGSTWRNEIRYIVLDPEFNIVAGPTTVSNSDALTSNSNVSVSADNRGRAILTWMNYSYFDHHSLSYALVASSGNILTPAMIFKTSQSSQPYLFSSFEGDGNTSYSWTPPAGVDNQLIVEPATVSGALNGGAVLDIQYRGRGGQTATGVTLTATLDPRLVYHSDTSGVTPTVQGNTVTWALPDVRLFDQREFRVLLRVSGAALGDLLPVQLALTATQSDLTPGDNNASIQVRVDRPFFLPLVLHRP